jgi:hypothetical protein
MMLKLKRARLLISVCSSLALLAFASCRSENNTPTTNSAATPETVVSSTPPYETKEPERYRATRTITSTMADGRTLVTKSSTVRDGEMRLNEIELVSKRVVLLDLPEGRFVLFPEGKVYADTAGQSVAGAMADDDGSSPEGMLHVDSGSTSYQPLGAETIAGREANKYRVIVNGAGGKNVSPSETLIWIDKALNMAIRSETKSDGSRIMMELSEISLEVDKSVFHVPADYQKVTLVELLNRLSSVK